MNTRQTHEYNRQAWNEAAARYELEIESDVALIKAGGKNLLAPELRILHNLKDWCGRVIHLQCAGGRDTLSLWNQGAKEIVGVDISDRLIECARRKSELLGAPATWYRSDVLDTPHELDATADLVYTGRGALIWIMDIDGWASVVKRLLRPGGRVYVFEGHPLDRIWRWPTESGQLEVDVDSDYGSYFSDVVDRSDDWPEEFIPKDVLPEKLSVKYERDWTVGAVATALARTGLRLELLQEHPDQYWEVFPGLDPAIAERVPHTYSLLMRNE